MANTISIDGNEYSDADLSKKALDVLAHLRMVDQKIVQNKQELVILQTARNAYAESLKKELPKSEQ